MGSPPPAWAGVVGFLLLVLLPGAWITFGLPLGKTPFWARLFTGAALAPLVVAVQFYALRVTGLPFATVIPALVVVNIPAAYLLWKNRPSKLIPPGTDWVLVALTLAVPTACLFQSLIYKDMRVYSPHAYVYQDPIYLLARGQLVVEDPSVAGIRLSYPVWSASIFQAAQSWLLDSPPSYSFVWINLIWLLLAYAFAGAITREMGGGRLAQRCAGIFLVFGINPLGYFLQRYFPAWKDYWGDVRYMPWALKYFLFSGMVYALAMTAAILYLLVRGQFSKSVLATIGLLLTGIGVLYPLLFPTACGIVAAKLAAVFLDDWLETRSVSLGKLTPWLLLLAVAIGITYIEIRFLTQDRSPASHSVLISGRWSVLRKEFASGVSTIVLLAGLAVTGLACWRTKRHSTVILLGGAAGCYLLHGLFFIPYWNNEYKFIFVISQCLVVFPSLAVERIWEKWPRPIAAAALSLTAALVLGAYLTRTVTEWRRSRKMIGEAATVDVSTFWLRLNSGQPWSALCDAVRTATPAETVLVSQNSSLYLPAFTARSNYVPVLDRAYSGVTIEADDLEAGARGLDQKVLKGRRADIAALFGDGAGDGRRQALRHILALGRSVAVVVEPQHQGLLEWLKRLPGGSAVHQDADATVWLVDAQAASSPIISE